MLRAYGWAKIEAHAIRAGCSRILLVSAHTWDPCIGDVFSTLAAGATLCVVPRAQLLQDLAGKAQYAVNMQQRALQTQTSVMKALKEQQGALTRAKKEEELEKRRIQEEVEKALKLRMIQVEKEERKHLQERIRDERERLQREAEERRR